jgi:hypothetical protein
MPKHMLYPDSYGVTSKILNVGDLAKPSPLAEPNFEFTTVEQYNPLTPPVVETYDGGVYQNGALVLQPTNIVDGGTYANGTVIPPIGVALNGGVYP